MALKTIVKVGNITNLSDARYCAGMGADLLGFQGVPGHPSYIEPARFQEFRGWFTGPRVVIELYGLSSAADYAAMAAAYMPDFLEVSLRELTYLPVETAPLLLRVTASDFNEHADAIHAWRARIHYLLLPATTTRAELEQLPSGFTILLDAADLSHVETQIAWPLAGFALQGTTEERPGIKAYDSLASILEYLETED